MTGIPMETLAGTTWGYKSAGKVGEALSANPQGTTAAFVQTAQEDDPANLPEFLKATYKEMSKHIAWADAAGNKVAKSVASDMGVGNKKLNPQNLGARKFVESRVAGLLGHHLDKDKWGAQ